METSNIYQKLFELKQKDIKLARDTEGYGYKYATLGQIQEKLGDYLKELNIVILHTVKDGYVVTQIRNLDGEDYIESSIKMLEDTKAQDKGSEITYFRRYNLLCLLDLETEDDDGKSGSNTPKKEDKGEKTQGVYAMTPKDLKGWNGKIYPGNSVYVDGEKKVISTEQIAKLKVHEKYVELPPKK